MQLFLWAFVFIRNYQNKLIKNKKLDTRYTATVNCVKVLEMEITYKQINIGISLYFNGST
jgi:hypothetical protein